MTFLLRYLSAAAPNTGWRKEERRLVTVTRRPMEE
jgi:hypothetical protein